MEDQYETLTRKRSKPNPPVLECLFGLLGLIVVAIAAFAISRGPEGIKILLIGAAIFIVLFVVFFCCHQFVIEGTSFNFFNYWIPFVRYAIVSQLYGQPGVKAFWESMETEPGECAGIGSNTTTYTSWEKAAKYLKSWPSRIADDTMKRHNNLGAAINGPAAWPETGKICLSYSREEHALCRPFVAEACDAGKVADGPCDGSNGWNRTYLRQFWSDRFDQMDTFNTTDTMWWIDIIFHKVMANIDLTDEEAQEFMGFPCSSSFPGFGKFAASLGNITDREWPFLQCCPPIPCYRAKAQAHAELFKEAIQEKWPDEDWDEEKLTLTAWVFMDSVVLAGGLSVPTVLQNMLAWWFAEDRPSDLDQVSAEDQDSIRDFMWETLRKNPPVAGVPRWITDDDGDTWQSELANVEQAMQDDTVFQDPMEFSMGRPGLNSRDNKRSLFWADLANVNGDVAHPNSHACPGKMLAQEILVSFWQEFLLHEWEPSTTNIEVGYNMTTTFDVTRLS